MGGFMDAARSASKRDGNGIGTSTRMDSGGIEMNDDKACQSTPPADLLSQIRDPNVAKNEREWAAHKHIADLESGRETLCTRIGQLETERERLREALSSIEAYGTDTLSGPAGSIDDRVWYRGAIAVMVRRSRSATDETPK